MALINRRFRQILRQRKQRPQGFKNNEFTRNNDHYYHCGKPGYIKQNCRKLRRRLSKKNRNFGA